MKKKTDVTTITGRKEAKPQKYRERVEHRAGNATRPEDREHTRVLADGEWYDEGEPPAEVD